MRNLARALLSVSLAGTVGLSQVAVASAGARVADVAANLEHGGCAVHFSPSHLPVVPIGELGTATHKVCSDLHALDLAAHHVPSAVTHIPNLLPPAGPSLADLAATQAANLHIVLPSVSHAGASHAPSLLLATGLALGTGAVIRAVWSFFKGRRAANLENRLARIARDAEPRQAPAASDPRTPIDWGKARKSKVLLRDLETAARRLSTPDRTITVEELAVRSLRHPVEIADFAQNFSRYLGGNRHTADLVEAAVRQQLGHPEAKPYWKLATETLRADQDQQPLHGEQLHAAIKRSAEILRQDEVSTGLHTLGNQSEIEELVRHLSQGSEDPDILASHIDLLVHKGWVRPGRERLWHSAADHFRDLAQQKTQQVDEAHEALRAQLEEAGQGMSEQNLQLVAIRSLKEPEDIQRFVERFETLGPLNGWELADAIERHIWPLKEQHPTIQEPPTIHAEAERDWLMAMDALRLKAEAAENRSGPRTGQELEDHIRAAAARQDDGDLLRVAVKLLNDKSEILEFAREHAKLGTRDPKGLAAFIRAQSATVWEHDGVRPGTSEFWKEAADIIDGAPTATPEPPAVVAQAPGARAATLEKMRAYLAESDARHTATAPAAAPVPSPSAAVLPLQGSPTKAGATRAKRQANAAKQPRIGGKFATQARYKAWRQQQEDQERTSSLLRLAQDTMLGKQGTTASSSL